MAWVTAELSSGRLQVGDKLPSERALAETLEVSRSSLREALRVLEALGTLSSGTGSGPNAGTVVTGDPRQALSLALKLQLATHLVQPSDVVATRVLLETWAALHPAADHKAALAEEVEPLLAAMDDPGLTPEEFLVHDAAFHAALTRSAGNPFISSLMEALRISTADYTSAIADQLANWGATAERLRAEHHEIYRAITQGDRAVAAELLRSHIEHYYREG